eukprot:16006982-Heterocapsa_arctica.AAC.1
MNQNTFWGTSEVIIMTYEHKTKKNNGKSGHTIYCGMEHSLRLTNEKGDKGRGGLVTEHLDIGWQKRGKRYRWINFMVYEIDQKHANLTHNNNRKAWFNYFMTCSYLAQNSTEVRENMTNTHGSSAVARWIGGQIKKGLPSRAA